MTPTDKRLQTEYARRVYGEFALHLWHRTAVMVGNLVAEAAVRCRAEPGHYVSPEVGDLRSPA